MFDLQVLAYQADLTRVITFMMGRELSGRTYPEIGIHDAHHPISHHQNDPEKLAKLIARQHASRGSVRLLPRPAARDARRRRLAARSHDDRVRRRHERRQLALARQPAGPASLEAAPGQLTGRTPPPRPGRHADRQPARHAAAEARRASIASATARARSPASDVEHRCSVASPSLLVASATGRGRRCRRPVVRRSSGRTRRVRALLQPERRRQRSAGGWDDGAALGGALERSRHGRAPARARGESGRAQRVSASRRCRSPAPTASARMVRRLLQAGANPNAAGARVPPLLICARTGSAEAVRALDRAQGQRECDGTASRSDGAHVGRRPEARRRRARS